MVPLQRGRAGVRNRVGPQDFFADSLIEYRWARDVSGLATSTLDQLVKPVIEICEFYDLVPWQLTPTHVDQYFSGPGKRAHATVRAKVSAIDRYFAFLEQRYAGEIARRFGVGVASPVDVFNRPQHRGEFGLRVPPSRSAMREFFSAWRASLPSSRKWPVACRNYVMTKIAYLSGVRAAELCRVKLSEVHWELGQWGRFVVWGKGSGGSGLRQRQAYLFEEGRALLWWYVEQVRGLFDDDPDGPQAPLWPSERLPRAAAVLNVEAPRPAVTAPTFRSTLLAAAEEFLPGPVTRLYPHLLRHACATHNYEAGMTLWEVQRLLGHEWTSTTVKYLSTAFSDPQLPGPERVALASASGAARRLNVDEGSLR